MRPAARRQADAGLIKAGNPELRSSAGRSGPSPDPLRRAVDGLGRQAEPSRQAGKRGDRGGRQSLDAVAVPSDATCGPGRLNEDSQKPWKEEVQRIETAARAGEASSNMAGLHARR